MKIKTLAQTACITISMISAVLGTKAEATIITSTLPEFSGNGMVTVGTFMYEIPSGEDIVSAIIDGTFGNSVVASTAPVDVFLDDLTVAQCPNILAPCANPPVLVPWAFPFAPGQLPLLADGEAVLTAMQTGGVTIRLGPTTLTLETAATNGPAPIPEPGTLLLIGSGLVGLGAGLWRRKKY